MPGFLKQSTASQSRALGPFVNDTDFKTPETGLTINNTDIKLVVNGAASANKNSGGGTHRVNGVYGVTFDATDTATVGEMEVSVNVSGALIVFDKFTVVEEAVYDMLFAASALGYIDNAPVNVAQFGGSNGTFASGRPEVNTSHAAGTAWGSGAITAAAIAADAITAAKIADNAIDAGAIASDAITAAKIATGAITAAKFASGAIDAAALAADAGTEIGTAVWATGTRVLTAATNLTTALATPTNITAGTITTATNVTTVNGLAANVITAASMAADAGTEIAAAVLTAAAADPIHANVEEVNNIQLQGAGTSGDKWRPA